ncbi:MAG: hypothetical protein ABII90_14545 [Bacteroidota bacterium]
MVEKDLSPPKNNSLAKAVIYLNENFRKIASQYYQDYIEEVSKLDQQLIKSISDLTDRCFSELEKNLDEKYPPDPSVYFNSTGNVLLTGDSKNVESINFVRFKVQGDFLSKLREIISGFMDTRLSIQKEFLKDGTDWLFAELIKMAEDSPVSVTAFYDMEDLKTMHGDSFVLKLFKFRKRTWAKITGKPVSVHIPFRELQKHYFPESIQITLFKLLKNYGKHSFQDIAGFQAFFLFMKNCFDNIEERIIRGDFSYNFLNEEKLKANLILIKNTERSEDYRKLIIDGFQENMQLINDDLKCVDISRLVIQRKRIFKSGRKLNKKINKIPDLWYKNQTLFFNVALMDLMLLLIEIRLKTIVQKVIKELEHLIESKILSTLKKQIEYLTAFVNELKDDPSASFTPPQVNWKNADDPRYYKEFIDKSSAEIKEAIGIFSGTIEIMGESRPKTGRKSLINFENKQYDKIDVISISLSRLTDYLIQVNLVEPLRQQINGLSYKLIKTIRATDDVVRLLSFSMNNPDREFVHTGFSQSGSGDPQKIDKKDISNFSQNIIEFINDGNGRIKIELSKTTKIKKNFFSSVSNCLNTTAEKLKHDSIILSSGNLQQYIKKSKRRTAIAARMRIIKVRIRQTFTKMWYRKSEGVLAARKLSPAYRDAFWRKTDIESEMRIEELLSMLDSVSPDPKVLDALPFYYKQLFMGKQNVDKAFWTGRNNALEDAQKAVKRFKDGFSGGLLIIGEQNSGKTFLSQYIVNNFFDNKKIYQINPPEGGSIRVSVFNNVLENELIRETKDEGPRSEVKVEEMIEEGTLVDALHQPYLQAGEASSLPPGPETLEESPVDSNRSRRGINHPSSLISMHQSPSTPTGNWSGPGGKYETLFGALPQNCAVIINDLELWWERSKNGFDIINSIVNLINDYGNKCFFIINVNSHSFRFINHIQPIDNYFLSIIECEPFNAEELKDIILFRHKSTGLKFELDSPQNGHSSLGGKCNESNISGWRQARLFSKYFNYSRGNVGVALQAWISNIKKVIVDDKRLSRQGKEEAVGRLLIEQPKLPDIERLKYLKPDWALLIIQFVLHKRLTLEKLQRIIKTESQVHEGETKQHLSTNENSLMRQINTLKRAGIVVENARDSSVLELNQFIRPHLVNELVDRGIL